MNINELQVCSCALVQLRSYAVVQLCSYAVVQLCSCAVVQLRSGKLAKHLGLDLNGLIHSVLLLTTLVASP